MFSYTVCEIKTWFLHLMCPTTGVPELEAPSPLSYFGQRPGSGPREPLVCIAVADVHPIILPFYQRRRPVRPFRGVRIGCKRLLHCGPHIVRTFISNHGGSTPGSCLMAFWTSAGGPSSERLTPA